MALIIERKLKATFRLGEGEFGNTGGNTLDVEGLRISATISKAGGPAMSNLELEIRGLPPFVMKALSTLGFVVTLLRRNTITLQAGDDINGMSIVFQGTIMSAFVNHQGTPDVSFYVNAAAAALEGIVPARPISIKGAADVAVMLSGLATQMGVPFENSGVDRKLSNSYYAGSPRSQALAIVTDAGIEWNGVDNGVLAIWNAGQARAGNIPIVSKDTGLVGYPSFTSTGIMFKMLFNPALGSLGQKIKMESSRPELAAANGTWVIRGLDYDLEANTPGGAWFASVQAARPGQAVIPSIR